VLAKYLFGLRQFVKLCLPSFKRLMGFDGHGFIEIILGVVILLEVYKGVDKAFIGFQVFGVLLDGKLVFPNGFRLFTHFKIKLTKPCVQVGKHAELWILCVGNPVSVTLGKMVETFEAILAEIGATYWDFSKGTAQVVSPGHIFKVVGAVKRRTLFHIFGAKGG